MKLEKLLPDFMVDNKVPLMKLQYKDIQNSGAELRNTGQIPQESKSCPSSRREKPISMQTALEQMGTNIKINKSQN